MISVHVECRVLGFGACIDVYAELKKAKFTSMTRTPESINAQISWGLDLRA